jgi:surface antigen
MCSNQSLFPLAAGGLTAFALVAALFVSSDFAVAAGTPKAQQIPGCSCPNSAAQKPTKPKFADLKTPLDESDEIAALESVQFALSEVADGSSYVWHRSNGRLSGVVKPLTSFKDGSGSVCRHVLVVLNSTDLTKKTEVVACRLTGGVWQLDG